MTIFLNFGVLLTISYGVSPHFFQVSRLPVSTEMLDSWADLRFRKTRRFGPAPLSGIDTRPDPRGKTGHCVQALDSFFGRRKFSFQCSACPSGALGESSSVIF